MPGNAHRRTAWFVLFVLLLATVAAPLNQFKVPPVMPLLMDFFALPVGRAGLLMSIFAVTGLLLALPAGFIFQKLGYRSTGMLAAGAVVVGAALGALSSDAGTILFSRVVEGVGTSLFAVVAPAVIAMWFAADQRGAPMGIWATWVPIGSTAMLILAPLIAQRWGWQGVWWFGCLFAAATGILFVLFVRPSPRLADGRTAAGAAERASWQELQRILRNRDIWLMSLVFCCFNFAFIGFVTWAPTFLNTVRGIPLSQASFLVSLAPLLNILSCPVAGVVSDRIGSRKMVCVLPLLAMAALWPLAYWTSGAGFVAVIVVLGLVSGAVPTGVFAAGPEIAGDERLSGMAMAVLQVGMNAGMLLGPLALGQIIDSPLGWAGAFGAMVPASVLGAVVAWTARVR